MRSGTIKLSSEVSRGQIKFRKGSKTVSIIREGVQYDNGAFCHPQSEPCVLLLLNETRLVDMLMKGSHNALK